MHDNKEVSKARPCPICGKPDYCCFNTSPGYEQVICKRTDATYNVQGWDGKFYVYKGVTRSDYARFEDAQQMYDREEARKKENFNNFKKVQATAPRSLTPVDIVNAKPNDELDKIYREMIRLLVLDDDHRAYLKNEGWTDEQIDKNHIVSFPERDFIRFKYKNNFSRNIGRKRLAKELVRKFGSLSGVPGAYQDEKGEWTFTGHRGILFPMYDVEGNLYRVRLRLDFTESSAKVNHDKAKDDWFELDGKKYFIVPFKGVYTLNLYNEKVFEKDGKYKGKYRNFASFYQNEEEAKRGFLVNGYKNGCESGNQLGIYYNYSRDNMFLCYLTEGEKKGIFANDKLMSPVVSYPGVGSWGKLLEKNKEGKRVVDILKEKGVKIFIIANDADKTKNKDVMRQEKNAIEALKKEGFKIGIANWPIEYGKGLDDLLANGHKPSYELA